MDRSQILWTTTANDTLKEKSEKLDDFEHFGKYFMKDTTIFMSVPSDCPVSFFK